MRGAIQYDRFLNMTYAERQKVMEFIENRMELQKKLPYSIL